MTVGGEGETGLCWLSRHKAQPGRGCGRTRRRSSPGMTAGVMPSNSQNKRRAVESEQASASRRRTRLKQSRDAQAKTASTRRCKRSQPGPSRFSLGAVRVILFYCLITFGGLAMLTSAGGLLSDEPQPEAQQLVYMMHELGSGEGLSGASYSRSGSSAPNELGSATTNADVSPALIEARCWNNYENDNICKQLNVITAPESERLNQQQQANEDDRIITPVVIFEASSTVDPSLESQSNELERPIFMAPPYQSPGDPVRDRHFEQKKHKQADEQWSTSGPVESYTATVRTTNVNMDNPSREAAPVTRPTVIHYVVTPQPKSGLGRKPATAKTKTTTQGRKCRDENDADCDEPDDNQAQPVRSNSPKSSSGSDEEDGESDDDDDDEASGTDDATRSSSSATGLRTNLINEPGSGGGFGSTDDDNDDSTDDGDDESAGDSSESSGANSIQENANSEATTKDARLLVITSSYPPGPKQEPSTTQTGRPEQEQSVSLPPSTRRPQSGAAEIEVVVHSTLPPSFPSSNTGQSRGTPTSIYDDFGEPTGASAITSSTTTLPDDTYTSRPIFPSSTLGSAQASSGGDATNEQQQTPASNQASQTTTEVDLYTFKPIPIPVEQAEARPSRFETGGANSDAQTQEQDRQQQQQNPKQEVSSQHIHEPAGHRRPTSYDRAQFDDGWTTRKPINSFLSSMGKEPSGGQQEQSLDVFMGGKRPAAKPYNHLGHEVLSTMLLYASITIVVFILVIIVVIAYFFWRRNNFRRQAMLAKAQMMNGRAPPGMIESMSHVSHLMHGADGLPPPQPPQQGLLSTYAQAKGSSMGKVTTSLVKPGHSGNGLLLEAESDEDEQDQEDRQESDSKDQLAGIEESPSLEDAQNQQQMRAPRLAGGINDSLNNQSGSWSTEDPTTTTSSGSQRTQDSQQMVGANQHQGKVMQNGQRTHNPYPNSLSDGRQNSSSISESQCSPDPGPAGGNQSMGPQRLQQPMNASSNQVIMNNSMLDDQQNNPNGMMIGNAPHHIANQLPYAQQQQRPALGGPSFRPLNGMGSPQMSLGAMPAMRQPFQPMMLQNGAMKQRLVASRSIEDIPPSQHVGFVNSPNGNNMTMNLTNQHHVPYSPQPRALPIQNRPQYQYPNQHVAMTASSTLRGSTISPQRIAMSPIATLSRRYPPGAGLNRNIYSEDSSSFMTTSPSLARTSSSSSFAFNMSNLPTPSSIKAKPVVDSSGRIFNDYTAAFAEHLNNNGNGNSSGGGAAVPPVFGRNDRSEAWYV